MFAAPVRQSAHIVTIVALVLGASLCHAVSPEEKAAEIGQLLTTPGGMALMAGVFFILLTLGVWISSKILGVEGGFWRSVVAAVIMLVGGFAIGKVFGSDVSTLISIVVATVVGAGAIKLCFETSISKAIVCSVLSTVMTTIIALVLVVAVGIKFALQ